MDILIIGGSAGGATVATNLRRLDEESKITVIEKGPDISFGNCSMPYYFSGDVEDIEDLIVNTPEDFKQNHNIDVLINTEVLSIDRSKKSIKIENLKSKEKSELSYDKLIMAPGASAVRPEGFEDEKVFTLRNVQDIRDMDQFVEETGAQSVAIVGGGYIGVEIAEAFSTAGLKVTLISSKDQLLPNVDKDMAQLVHKKALDKGIDIILESRGKEIKNGTLTLDDDSKIDADMYILAIGVDPNTDLAENSGLKIGETGGILVDLQMKTTDPDIYSIGDAVELTHKLTGEPTMLQLAFMAHRQAGIVADDIYGYKGSRKSVIGSSSLKFFDLNIGATGLTENQLKDQDKDYKVMRLTQADRVMGDKNPIHLKLLYNDSYEILGVQGIGEGDVDKRIDIAASILYMGGDLIDLANNERAYSPFFSLTEDITNVIAQNAILEVQDRYETLRLDRLDQIQEDGVILDSRPEKKYQKSHLERAINIPHRELRDRIDELDKSKKIYTQSFNTYFLLKNLGYEVINIQGTLTETLKHYKTLEKLED